MARTMTVIFDGEVFRPTELVDLPRDTVYSIQIEQADGSTAPRRRMQIEAIDLAASRCRLDDRQGVALRARHLWSCMPETHYSLVNRRDEQSASVVGLPRPCLPTIATSRGKRFRVEVFVGNQAAVSTSPAVDVGRCKRVGIVDDGIAYFDHVTSMTQYAGCVVNP